MSDRRERAMGDARTAPQRDRTGPERYLRRQREIRSGRARATDGVRPLEFDENGFPIKQSSPSFVERVARLLSRSRDFPGPPEEAEAGWAPSPGPPRRLPARPLPPSEPRSEREPLAFGERTE